MELSELQRVWTKLGAEDPMWAVLTDTRFVGGKWDPAEFFASGVTEVDELLQRARSFGLVPKPAGDALDFGCGAGRLTQALAESFATVVGVDIAESMVAEAERWNAHRDKCRFLVNTSADLGLFDDGSFEFVLCLLVLQHMEPRYSRGYISEFLRILGPGGVLIFQLPSVAHEALQPSLRNLALDDGAYSAELTTGQTSIRAEAGTRRSIAVTVRNRGTDAWPPATWNRGIGVGNHWYRDDGTLLQLDDGRAHLSTEVDAGARAMLSLDVSIPAEPGRYVLELDMVHESINWFADRGSPTLRIPVTVHRPGPLRRLRSARASKGAVGEPPAAMEMYVVPEAEVVELISAGGGTLAGVERREVPQLTDCTYFVTKS